MTALKIAVAQHHHGTAKTLLEKGANVNLLGSGYSPLTMAVISGDDEMVILLLKKGAGPNTKDQWNTPLEHAFEKSKPKIAEILLKGGATSALKMEDGKSMLEHCAEFAFFPGEIDVINVMLTSDKKLTLEMKQKAFLQAASSGHFGDRLQMFVDNGVDINVKNKNGDNALTLAVNLQNVQNVQFLVKSGVELTEVTLQFASLIQNPEIIQAIRSHKDFDKLQQKVRHY